MRHRPTRLSSILRLSDRTSRLAQFGDRPRAGCTRARAASVWLFMRERPIDVHIPPWGGGGLRARAGNAAQSARGSLRRAAGRIALADILAARWCVLTICGASTNGLIGAASSSRPAAITASPKPTPPGCWQRWASSISSRRPRRVGFRIASIRASCFVWYYGLRWLSLLFLPYAFGLAVVGLPAFARIFCRYDSDCNGSADARTHNSSVWTRARRSRLQFGELCRRINSVRAWPRWVPARGGRSLKLDQAFIAAGVLCFRSRAESCSWPSHDDVAVEPEPSSSMRARDISRFMRRRT